MYYMYTNVIPIPLVSDKETQLARQDFKYFVKELGINKYELLDIAQV